MIDLTMVFSVYGQPRMLDKQIATMFDYSPEVCRHLSVVIVDDCGDPPVDADCLHRLSLLKSVKLLRVTKDIPWNQHGCRNLAMEHAQGWCLLMDPDFVFDGDTLRRLMQCAEKLTRGRVAKYGLTHKSNGKLDMTSPNTWLMHRDDFFAIGGCDEDFSGHKGWADVQLLDLIRACYKIEMRPDLSASFYGPKDIEDAMVSKLDRSTAANKKKRVKKVGQARAAGGWARWAKTRVNLPRIRFPWTMVFQSPCETSAQKT